MSTYTLRFTRHGINGIGHTFCSTLQLIQVNRISTVYARAYITDCFTAIIQAVFSKAYSITASRGNSYTATIHNRRITSGILSRHRLKTFQIFCHTNLEISSIRYDA